MVKASGLKKSDKNIGVLMAWLDDPAGTPKGQTRCVSLDLCVVSDFLDFDRTSARDFRNAVQYHEESFEVVYQRITIVFLVLHQASVCKLRNAV